MDGAVSLWERYGTHLIILDHRVLPLRLATYYYCFTAALFQFIILVQTTLQAETVGEP